MLMDMLAVVSIIILYVIYPCNFIIMYVHSSLWAEYSGILRQSFNFSDLVNYLRFEHSNHHAI